MSKKPKLNNNNNNNKTKTKNKQQNLVPDKKQSKPDQSQTIAPPQELPITGSPNSNAPGGAPSNQQLQQQQQQQQQGSNSQNNNNNNNNNKQQKGTKSIKSKFNAHWGSASTKHHKINTNNYIIQHSNQNEPSKVYHYPSRQYPVNPNNFNTQTSSSEIHLFNGFYIQTIIHFIQQLASSQDAPRLILQEVRHHLASGVLAYVHAAGLTTQLPEDITNKLNDAELSNHSIVVDPSFVKIMNAFMPIGRAVQLNVDDILTRCSLVLVEIDKMLQVLTDGVQLTAAQYADVQTLVLLNSNNYLFKIASNVLNVATTYTTLKQDEIKQSTINKLQPELHYTTVDCVKLPTFAYKTHSQSKSTTKKAYTVMVRNPAFVYQSNPDKQGVSYSNRAPDTEHETIMQVNSTLQYFVGFEEWHAESTLMSEIIYQNRLVGTVPRPSTPVSMESDFTPMTPQNYQVPWGRINNPKPADQGKFQSRVRLGDTVYQGWIDRSVAINLSQSGQYDPLTQTFTITTQHPGIKLGDILEPGPNNSGVQQLNYNNVNQLMDDDSQL